MLKDCNSSAIVAVRELARARRFYEETLGLELEGDGSGGVLAFRTGATRLIVYPSDHAGTNRANAVVWSCGDEIDAIVAALEAKDAAFEHYPELEGVRIEGNVHVAGAMKLVWLKDPDGNILHLNNM
jgi:catechol 2,3-dioxygenase-like lactoylglutathione lyase family enzyme